MKKQEEDKLLKTVKSLVDLNQLNAIIAIQQELKERYEKIATELDNVRDHYKYVSKILEGYSNSIHQNSTLKNTLNNTNYKTYDSSLSLPKKFKYFLNRESRFLKFREAAELIVKKDGTGDIDKITRQLTYSLKAMKQKHEIIGISPNERTIDTFWGYPEWLDEVGNIKPDYLFNYNALVVNDSLVSPYNEYKKKKEPNGST